MTIYNVPATTSAVRIVTAGDGPCLIINRDHSTAILIGNDPGVGTVASVAVTTVDPLGTIAVNGNIDVYAVAVTGTVVINVQADASQWSPSSNEITATLFEAIAQPVGIGYANCVSSGLIDVRGFSSFYLNLDADLTVPSTGFNSFLARLTWLPRPPVAGESGGVFMILSQDVYEYWVFQGSGTALFNGGDLMVADIMHGPYLQLDIVNLGGDAKTIDYHLIGTTRNIPHPFVTQPRAFILGSTTFGNPNDEGADGYLVYQRNIIINNGATIRVPALFGHGRVQENLSTGGGALTFSIQAGFELRQLDTVTLAANSISRVERVLPKRSLLYTVTNTSGVGSAFSIFLTAQRDRV